MKHKKYDLFVPCLIRTKYDNHLRVLKPHIWNSLPEEIKQLFSVNAFKNYLKSWCGSKASATYVKDLLNNNKHLT